MRWLSRRRPRSHFAVRDTCRPHHASDAGVRLSGVRGSAFLLPWPSLPPCNLRIRTSAKTDTWGKRGNETYSYLYYARLSGAIPAFAQGIGNSGTITGTVTDPSGAAIAGRHRRDSEQSHRVRQNDHDRDATGAFRFLGVPQNNYHTDVKAAGFQDHIEDIDVRTTVAVNLMITMGLASSTTSVEVHSDTDLVESVPTAHVDVDSSQFEKLPMSSVASGLNAVIAHSAPGIIEDSNGFIHPQGDHAQTQFVFDNQPITDQQSKQFSTSMPENAIASVEVITGAPPAEYGDKTSLVINAITKSGLGVDKSFGSFATELWLFGTTSESITFGEGGKTVGRFHFDQRRALRPLSRSARIFRAARRREQ